MTGQTIRGNWTVECHRQYQILLYLKQSIRSQALNYKVQVQYYRPSSMSSNQEEDIRVISIVGMSLFTSSALFSIYGMFRGRKASNSAYLKIFFTETLTISVLEIVSLVLAYENPSLTNIKLEFIQRCVNSFAVIFQFALILTIAYGWKVACWKIQQSTYSNFNSIRASRTMYIIVVTSLFLMELIGTIALFIYLLATDRTSQLALNILDMAIQFSILGGCVIQLIEGRKFSKILHSYQILFGAPMRRFRFNLIYIVAFMTNLARCVTQLITIGYYFIFQRIPPVISNNKPGYYIMYLTLEFTPIALYLVSIKVSGNQNAKEEETARDHSNRNSIMTEMVDRMSMDL